MLIFCDLRRGHPAVEVNAAYIELHIDGDEGLHGVDIEPELNVGHGSDRNAAKVDRRTDGGAPDVALEEGPGARSLHEKFAASKNSEGDDTQSYGAENEAADDGWICLS